MIRSASLMKKFIHIAISVAFYIICLCIFVWDTNTVYAEVLFTENAETVEITEQEKSGEKVLDGICFHGQSGYFRLYENGVMNNTKGWHKLSDGNQVYVTSDGYITAKLQSQEISEGIIIMIKQARYLW